MDDQEQSQAQEATTDPVATQEAPTPTAEQLKAELDALRSTHQAEILKHAESYKGLQRTLNQRDAQLKQQLDIKSELDALREMQKLQAAIIAERLNLTEDSLDADVQKRKPDLLARFDAKEKEIAEGRKQRAIQEQQRTLQEQIDGFKTRTEALGLKDDDESYWEIHDLVTEGKFQRAEIKLKKLEATKKPAAATESEEIRINRLAEEKLQKMMQEKGLLKTETASPSGRSVSREDIIRRYGEGDPSIKVSDYLAATGRG